MYLLKLSKTSSCLNLKCSILGIENVVVKTFEFDNLEADF